MDEPRAGYFCSSFLMKYGLTIDNFRTFCALVLGVHFGPNIHSKMTLRTKSTYPNLITIGEKKRKASECIIWGREEKSAAECVYLVQRTMYGAGSMASAAVVGATVVGAAAVGSVVFGAAEVCVTSGVLYGAVLVQ